MSDKSEKPLLYKVIMEAARLYRRKYRLGFKYSMIIHMKGRVRTEGRYRINVPVRIEGQGSLHLGHNVTLGHPPAPRSSKGEILIQPRTFASSIAIGNNTSISNNVSIVSNCAVTIGQDGLIGNDVLIMDSDFHDLSPETRHKGQGQSRTVSIEDNVWIGSRATILKGVTIGKNSVIATGSVVTKSIPPNVVAGGNPASIIKDI